MAPDAIGVGIHRAEAARWGGMRNPRVAARAGYVRRAGVVSGRSDHLPVAHPDGAVRHDLLLHVFMTAQAGGCEVAGVCPRRNRSAREPGDEVVGGLEIVTDDPSDTRQGVAIEALVVLVARAREAVGGLGWHVTKPAANLRARRDDKGQLKAEDSRTHHQ